MVPKNVIAIACKKKQTQTGPLLSQTNDFKRLFALQAQSQLPSPPRKQRRAKSPCDE